MPRAKSAVLKLLGAAGGTVGGGAPGDIVVHDERFYARVLTGGSLGLGEAYIDGWWDASALDDFITKILLARLDKLARADWRLFGSLVINRLFNRQSRARAFRVGERHYDIGNDLYRAMLDRRLTYTCGYWRQAQNLDEAQEAKLDLVCRKLGLKAGQRVLDIGCGWGSLAKFAAERYGVSVVGVTVSKEQVALGRELCAGLPVEIRLQDYRELDGRYDAVVSLGMFEHVGPQNYATYMAVVARCLAPGGLCLLHTIGKNVTANTLDPWVDKYIFPNGIIPSSQQISAALERDFVMEDWHNFGADYDRTLLAWEHNFTAHWPELRAQYSERFYRLWRYYLLSSAGAFRARQLELWQIVLAKGPRLGGYQSMR